MYAMNIQNDFIGLVPRENCKLKQITDFIAWPSRCHDTISEKQINKQIHFIANLFHLLLLLYK